MPLENERLEQLHTELRSLLAEREGEVARSRQSGSDAARELERLAAEIDAWEADARKLGPASDEEKAIAALADRAREINQKLSAGRPGASL
ncbi:hypothetical protein ACUXV3_19375 (plasmid) [Roseobacteraceae bacterium NS-SX3]